MIKTYLSSIVIVFLPYCLSAQVIDDFNDGDFTNSPVWAGDDSEFEIEGNQLNSLGPSATSVLYLSTPNGILNNATWEFLIDLQFAPSGSNKVRAYLMSDQADLEGNLNGYFVEVGETGDDEIRFFRQDDDGTETELFVGSSSLSGNVTIGFQITRDDAGNWQINADTSGGTSYASEGSSFLDNTYTSTSYFGFVCFHSSTRKDLFFFDNISVTAPVSIESIATESNTGLRVTFNQNVDQTSAELSTNYSIDNSITVSAANRDAVNLNEVVLTVSTMITNTYDLTVSNIADEATVTPLVSPDTESFAYTQLELQSLVTNSDTEVQLTFNDDLDQTTAETATNYSINNSIGNPSTATLDAVDNSIVILTLSSSLATLTNYTLTYGDIDNSAKNSTVSAGTMDAFLYVIPLTVDAATAISKTEVELEFNQDLDQTTAETAFNYSIDNSIGNPTSVVQNSTDLNKVTLTLGSGLTENTFTITIDNVEDAANNPIAAGSTIMFSYLPMEISGISTVSNTELEITFNQNIDQTTAETTSNYSADGELGSPSGAVLNSGDNTKVNLTFANEFVNNTYTVAVNNVTNSSSNAIASSLNDSFSYETATDFRTIVINEIFADPTGSSPPNPVVLPTGSSDEFVEIYNVGNRTINIGDFDLTGGTVPDFTLAPGAYVILTATSNTGDFTSFGGVLGVTSFNGLSNAGEQITLTDNLGNLVDSLTYDTDWYKDTDKSDGAWTIEQVNPELSCGGYISNWTASTDVQGGTPGTQNSVYDITPDTAGPSVISMEAVDNNTFRFTFDEPMDETSLNSGTYAIDNGLGQTSIAPISGSFSVDVDLDGILVSGTTYTATISGVTDCTGNTISTNVIALEYDINPPVIDRIIIQSLNEISVLFDEGLTESIAEVESNYTVDNSIGSPSSAILDNIDNQKINLTFTTSFNDGQQNTISIQNLEDLKGNAISGTIDEPFTYAQNIDTVLVIGANLLDVQFSLSVEETLAETLTNYFVSGGAGNPVLANLDDTDNTIVHLVFNEDLDENSDLTLTIENLKNISDEFISTPEYIFIYDTNEPELTSISVQDATTILLGFDEFLEQVSAEVANNYSYNETFASSAVLQSDEKSVLLTFLTDFQRETILTLNITGLRDLFGNTLSSTIKEDFFYDVFPPQVDSLQVLSPTSLLVIFNEDIEEISAETVSNYTLDSSVGSPMLANRKDENNNIVLLDFGTTIPSTDGLLLDINNISDLQGNVISTTVQSSFDYGNISIGNIVPISRTSLQITFDKTPEATLASDAGNYSINTIVATQSVVDGANDEVYILTLGEDLIDNTTNSLSIANITDESANTLKQNDFTFNFDTQFNTLKLISSNTLDIDFDVNLDATSATNSSNFDLSPSIGNPSIITLDQDKVRLIFSSDFVGGTDYSLAWVNISDEFNNRLPDFSYDFRLDEIAPMVTEVTAIFDNILRLKFNEPLNESSAEDEDLYFVDNSIGVPFSATYNSADSTVLIEFSATFSEGTNYNLNVDRVQDESGNLMSNQMIAFTFTTPSVPQPGELLITEILADPFPTVGLPEIEYVEIYNNSSLTFNLITVNFSDDTNTVNLGDYELDAGEYLILTSDASAFTSFGSVVEVSGFPTLTNSGETLSLTSSEGDIIDQASYETSWYRDQTKDDGGYSLERIFFADQCLPELNWIASADAVGGTPGSENSVLNVQFDTTSPNVVAAEIFGTDALVVYFDEVLDSLSLESGTFTFTNGLALQSVAASNSGVDSVLLTFTTDLTIGTLYNLVITNVTDCGGNSISGNSQNFGIGKVPEYGDLLFTEIMPDQSPAVGLPEAEFIEIYNNTGGIINLQGIQLADASDTTSLPDFVLESAQYIILSSTSNEASFTAFGNAVGVTSFPSLGNTVDSLYLFLSDNTLIDQFFYTSGFYKDEDKDDGGFSLERIFLAEQCIQELNWMVTSSVTGGTPGSENSLFNMPFDFTSPLVQSLETSGTKSLIIHFDEVLDSISLKNGTYVFSDDLTIQNVSVSNSGVDSVLIEFTTDLTVGTLYNVTISDISDCFGNTIESTVQEFGIGKIPEYGDLLFTEIMPDPSPPLGLPNAEFIEIYNSSSAIINLEGIQLADASDTTSLPSLILRSGQYVILSSNSNVENFEPFGNTLGVTSFPSLGNSVDSLYLFLNDNTLINRLFYTSDFYKDEIKDDGGYSLERVFFAEQCLQELNWIASIHVDGGTPGAENAVLNSISDTQVPELLSLTIIDNQSIQLNFNEPMDSLSLVEGSYALTQGLAIDRFENVKRGGSAATLVFTSSIQNGTVYNISVSNVTDCAGNLLNTTSLDFGLGEKPDFNELIITEIMADPDADAGSNVSLPPVEYLELYNPTNKNIELSDLVLKDGTSDATLSPYTLFANQYLLLVPNGDEEFYPEIPVLPVKGWPSLNNGGETIAIFNADNLVFSLTYHGDWYKDSDKSGGGYSLEMIDTSNPCGDINNWTATEDSRGGTPAESNSVATNNPDNFGPQLVDAIANNSTKVSLLFDEKLNPSSIANVSSDISPSIDILAIESDSVEIKVILATLVSDLTENQEYDLTVTGVTDCIGNLIRNESNTATFVLPGAADSLDIVLNEILFNPRTNGVDFVEVYNNSEKAINLKGWQLASINDDGEIIPKTITDNDLVIASFTYKVFTTGPANIKENYPGADESTFVQVSSLSSMPNDEGTVIILDSLNNQIDRFDYSDDFHFNLLDDVNGVSLERINFTAETNNPNSWKSAASTAGFATPGLPNSQFKTETQTAGTLTIEPKVFVPDNTGVNNFTTINYDLDNAGSFANITIYNHRGQPIKTIAQGDLLSTSGFFTWDGTDDAGERASFGYYVIYFEIFDVAGNKDVMKETIVLGARF